MFDLVHRNKRIAQVVLALIFLPFALFGVERYFSSIGGGEYVAKVGGYRITQQEFTQALREEQDRMRNQMGDKFNPIVMEDPETRASVLENLIKQHLLLAQAARAGMTASDLQLQKAISEFSAFQENGKFSKNRYETLLRNQGLNPLSFEAKMRQDMVLGQLAGAFESEFVPQSVADRLIRLSQQEREVSQHVLSIDQYLLTVKVSEEAAKHYYEEHHNEFQTPEQVRAEYVVLSADNLGSQIKVSAEESRKYYDEHPTRFQSRQASHILISVPPNASSESKAQARAVANQLYQEVVKNPAEFAELAKKNSQDPGSATKGGDLGFMSRGSMVKPFEDAVFQMKEGEIAGPVETQYGYHIIKLNAIKQLGYEEARNQIERELKEQQAIKKFNELAENFSNMVYEQPDSLKPVAQAFKLTIQQSPWLTRDSKDAGLLSNDKLLQALFSDDAVKNKRNTETIEVAPNTLVAAHVMEHKAASLMPFQEARAGINKILLLQQASELAKKEGMAKLEMLQQGKEVNIKWSAPTMMSRQRAAPGLGISALRAVFTTDVSKLPAYAGAVDPEGGYMLFKIIRVQEPDRIDETNRKELTEQLRQLIAQEQFSAYLASLRQKTEVKINYEQLEKKER
ncbi:MAG TPA: SurA N-terminal domain-containing protein [Burkholderiales bacterium]|nr:SurA N-terminal domain-containing protein [Burkholderiales bacterium]